MKTLRLSRGLLGMSAGCLLAAGVLLPSCGGGDDESADPEGGGNGVAGANAGGSHAGGKSGANAGGSNAGGTSGANAGGNGGAAGDIVGGNAGTNGSSTGGSSSGNNGTSGAAGSLPDVPNDGCSNVQPPAESPQDRKCSAPTNNECDGQTDINPAFPNGPNGNGVDDDCDGQVDEGCPCTVPAGTTKECFLVSGSQIDPNTGKPSGYCLQNPGTITCIAGGIEGDKYWDGYCKGAQPPYHDDACAPGDFDCDGVDANPAMTDCTCDEPPVLCPTDPVIISPFPNPTNLQDKKANQLDLQDPDGNQEFIVNGFDWVRDDLEASTTNWKWTVTGGDCDNILPSPTFAIFAGKDTTTLSPIGNVNGGLGSNGKQRGWVVGPIAGTAAHQIWPAFALSGDYSVTGEFKIGNDAYSCNLRVQVRQLGLRAELCWDTVGFENGAQSDVDLHLARLQGSDDTPHAWFKGTPNNVRDDTYWNLVDPPSAANPYNIDAPDWSHPASPAESCVGWASPQPADMPNCPNPRLDKDNVRCNPMQLNPNVTHKAGSSAPEIRYCGPENINLDNPFPTEQFLVGVNLYNGIPAKAHVNVYCNGVRKLSLGYDPTTEPSTDFPFLKVAGQESSGDFWTAARVTWNGGLTDDACSIETVTADTPKPDKEGGTGLCVETNPKNQTPATGAWWLTADGSYPTGPIGDCCYH